MNLLVVALFMPVAVYRLTRLIVKDDFPPILWVRDRLAGGWRPLTTKEQEILSRQPGWNHPFPLTTQDGKQLRWNTRRRWSPYWLGDLISCPWCASAYVAAGAAVYGACLDWYTWPVALVVWLYAWGVAAVVASKEWA